MNLNDLTVTQLDEIWKATDAHRAAMCKRRAYYDGQHAICGRNERHADGRKKAEVPTNFAGYIVDMYVGAMTSSDYQLSRITEDAQDTTAVYTDLSRDAHLAAVDVENLRNALVCGYGLEVHEYVDGAPRVIAEAPENWALLRDENGDITIAITRFVMDKWRVFRDELLTDDTQIQYAYDGQRRVGWRRTKRGELYGDWQQFDDITHFYGSVPVVEWTVNDERASILTDALIRQIDEYNDIDSLSGDDIRNVSDALLKIKGVSPAWVQQNADNITRLRILPLADDSDAEYLTKTTDTARITDRLSRCREAIHLMAGVPDIQQIVGATGGTSGIALQLKFMPMQQRAGAMFKHLEKALAARVDVLNTMLRKAGKSVITDYQITMQFVMPINRIEEWQNIGALDGIVTRRTQLELLTDIDDPEGELEQLTKEQATQAEITALNTPPEQQAVAQDAAVARGAADIDGTIQNALDVIGDRLLAAFTRTQNGN